MLSCVFKCKPILIIFFQELSSEERFHVELHFSPGAKGCEEDKNLPAGYGYRPASREVIIALSLEQKFGIFFSMWTHLK